MRPLPAAAALAALLAPAAAGLGVLPPEPHAPQVDGLETVRYRIPVRTDAGPVTVLTPGDPVGSVGLAPTDGTPQRWHPLQGEAQLAVPPPEKRCWHGYCGVHHVVVKLVAPNVDGSTTVPLLLAVDGTGVRVPLHLTVDPREPQAQVRSQLVTVETPHSRLLDGVHLQGPNGSWEARSTSAGFAVARNRLPAGVPLAPVLILANGTPVRGPPVTLPPDEAGGTESGAAPPGLAGRANGSGPPADGHASTPANDSRPGPPGLPTAPARQAETRRSLPAAGGLALAALAAAARATL